MNSRCVRKQSIFFKDEIYCKRPKKKYNTDKTDVYYLDNICSSNILDLNDYDPESKRGFGYILFVIDNLSELGWAVPLKKEYSQTTEDSFENNLIYSESKPDLLETDDGEEFVSKTFTDLFKNKLKDVPETFPWQ